MTVSGLRFTRIQQGRHDNGIVHQRLGVRTFLLIFRNSGMEASNDSTFAAYSELDQGINVSIAG